MTRIKEVCRVTVARLAELVASSSYAFSAWHMSMLTFLWGLWLVLPFETFLDTPAFDTMSKIAPEQTWGFVMMIMGAAKLHFVIHKKTISLAVFCLMTGYVWLVTGISFLFSDPSNTGGVVYIMLGIYEFWLYKRLAGNRRP